MFLHKKFNAGTYPIDYWVVVSDEPKKAKRFIDKKLGTDEPTTDEELGWAGLFCSIDEPSPILIIHLNGSSSGEELLKACVHELLHLCFWVMDWSSIKLSDETSEAFTHLLDYLVGQVIPWLTSKKLLKM